MTNELQRIDNVLPSAITGNEWTQERLDLIKRMYCKGSTNDECALFFRVCQKTGLSPEGRQIYAVKRWNAKDRREEMSIQTSIDGFRLIAERSKQYAGQLGPYWCGEDGVWKDVWLSREMPWAAKVGVLRNDFKEPLYAVARFSSYRQTNKEGQLTKFWSSMPDLMIAKVAEALALRRAFPQELSDLYTGDEMAQATVVDVEEAPASQTAPQQAPAIEAPAAPIEAKEDDVTVKLLAAFEKLGFSKWQVEQEIEEGPMDSWSAGAFAKARRLYSSVTKGKRDEAAEALQGKFKS